MVTVQGETEAIRGFEELPNVPTVAVTLNNI